MDLKWSDINCIIRFKVRPGVSLVFVLFRTSVSGEAIHSPPADMCICLHIQSSSFEQVLQLCIQVSSAEVRVLCQGEG